MKKIIIILFTGLVLVAVSYFFQGCASTSSGIEDKSGTQLWGENCVRCHNTPPSTAFGNVQWEVISMHMQLRANLTEQETKEILEFLQSVN